MARRVRQLSLRECYDILGLQKGADLAAVKHAYRKKAFELHPDLNPGNIDAGRQFQLVNEAYVALSAILQPAEEAREKAQQTAQHAEEQEKQTENTASSETSHTESQTHSTQGKAFAAYEEQDVLRDLLNDPFARRVFEDIYSQLNNKKEPEKHETQAKETETDKPEDKKIDPPQKRKEARVVPLWEKGSDKGVKGIVKDWLRKQIDDEQTLRLAAARLAPGRKVRLHIRRGLSDELSEVEVTLPKDFAPGKPMRLRGLGKRVGPWQGDLYLTIVPV